MLSFQKDQLIKWQRMTKQQLNVFITDCQRKYWQSYLNYNSINIRQLSDILFLKLPKSKALPTDNAFFVFICSFKFKNEKKRLKQGILEYVLPTKKKKKKKHYFNSIQFKFICIALFTIQSLQALYRKLSFYNIFIHCRNLILKSVYLKVCS